MTWYTAVISLINSLVAWITTICFWAAILFIGPWILALVYDLVLYLWRSLSYEIPVIGGRARGSSPPRAPTLTERTDGEARPPPISIPESVGTTERRGLGEGDIIRRRVMDAKDGG